MKFLNKKEQVIDLEITPYGKHLLSKGLFRPEFYAFYDDETIYDSRYGGFSEVQNSASVRINEAVQLETQAHFYSIEDQSRQSTNLIRTDTDPLSVFEDASSPASFSTFNPISITPEKNFSNRPLGRSSIAKSKLPGWNIRTLKGTIGSSNQFYSGSDKTYNIPQINLDDIVCTLEMSDNVNPDTESFYFFQSNNKLNEKVLNFNSDSIVIEIDEQNTDFEWENFDLEVFEIETETVTNSDGTIRNQEFLKPLFFRNNPSLIENGILLDEPSSDQKYVPTDPNYNDYYFNVFVDNEIDKEELCNLNPEDKPLGVFSKRQVECDELGDQELEGIETLYDTEEFDGECE